ncbi:MAG: hypothetical protein QXL09_02585 [Candidatus Aenigmatarchaeota archaeon]
MISLEELKKKKAKKEERKKLESSLFTRMSFILDNSTEEKLQELQQALEKGFEDFVEEKANELIKFKAKSKQKEKIEVPPFYLIPEEKILAVEKVLKYSNPYFNFANNVDELIAAHFLYKINPSIDEKLLEEKNLMNLIYAKIAEDILAEIKIKKEEIEDKIKKEIKESERNCLKEIGQKFGIKYNDHINISDFLAKIVDKAKATYIEETLLKTFGARDLESITKKVVAEFKNKSGKYEEYLNILKINKKDYLVSMNFGTLEALVKKKLEIFKEEIKEKMGYIEIEQNIEKITHDLIGKKVKLYPGGNPNGFDYDVGGTIRSVPSGSEGIIIDIRTGKYEVLVKLKDQDLGWGGSSSLLEEFDTLAKKQPELCSYKGGFWWVKLREIKIIENPLVEFIQEKYGLSEPVAISILKNNYEQILTEYQTQKLAQLEKEKLKLINFEKYLTTFLDH